MSQGEDLYNVNKYTDAELYDILDLNAPTDRELEAKILLFIKNYETIVNSSTNPNTMTAKNAKTMISFFEDIYHRFFEIEEEEDASIQEGFESGSTPAENTAPNPAVSNTIGNPVSSQLPTATATAPAQQSIGYTRSFEYSKSSTNPLLKETITRIISIDSQFRDQSIHSSATDFTFNLSDTLQDVVSLKLYSIQIPYNWWTINRNFGSNYFYLKGNAPGIIGNDYQIAINSGTYPEPQDLINAIQESIVNLKNKYTDVSFGTTNISVGQLSNNTPNSLATVVIDITNLYNENYYYLDWVYTTSPANALQRQNSIPGFFGFYSQTYIPNTFYSASISNNIITDNIQFTIDNTNNFFNIYLYDSSIFPYHYESSAQILVNIPIQLPLTPGNYTRNSILNAVNVALQATQYTYYVIPTNTTSTSAILDTTQSNMTYNTDPNNTGNSKYSMTIQLQRINNPYASVPSIKVAVGFPTETHNIWTQANATQASCFYFLKNNNEANTIVSETPSLTTTYTVTDSQYIFFQCTKPYFDNSLNNIVVKPVNGSYPLIQYLAAINTSFTDTSYVTASQVFTQTNTAYVEFDINVYKRFGESTYFMDLSGSYLNQTMKFDVSYSGTQMVGTITSSFPFSTGGYNINSTNNTFYLYPDKTLHLGNQTFPGYKVLLPIGGYQSYIALQNAIQSAFTNSSTNGGTFIHDASMNPSNDLAHCTITITPSGNDLAVQLNIIIYNVLSQSDYNLSFVDLSSTEWIGNQWNKNFSLQTPDISNNTYHNAYILSNYINTTLINNPAQILGTQAVKGNLITINSKNQTFYFRARPNKDGVYTSNQETDLSFTIPIGTYTKEQLESIMNTDFSNNAITNGTVVGIDPNTNNTTLKMNINNIYTAKDYNLVFYDIYSFVYCNTGVTGTSSKRNVTKDATLGWIMGFRSETIYHLSDPAIDTTYSANVPLQGSIYNGTKIATLMSDTTVNTNLYNYFLLILNDYTQNHLNDGLVTLITKDTSIPLPSYAERSTYVCDPITGKLTLPNSITNTNSSGNALTQNQIYSANAILQNKASNINYLSNGPFIQDVFALLPIKLTSLNIGQVYVEYGGTMQQQERTYFGPVNIHRMSVQLITDRGDVLDLNGANWSFGLMCQQLYRPPKS
jgi:hypothetical protein